MGMSGEALYELIFSGALEAYPQPDGGVLVPLTALAGLPHPE